LLLLSAFLSAGLAAVQATEPAKTRVFRLTYAATLNGLPAGGRFQLWVPVPSSSSEQEITVTGRRMPGEARLTRDPRYSNEIIYTSATADAAGKAQLELTYHVRRSEVRGERASAQDPGPFLKADARVPVDGKPLTLLAGKEIPRDRMAAARLLYDTVYGHMRYSKEGTGWGQGDAAWACESGYGNCSDFHSLFISLARSQGIPAQFEIGFGLPVQRGQGDIAGYHCWAWFNPSGRGWVPVDISEARKNPALRDYYFGKLTADRVTFSTGRDLVLEPKQAGPPLNFFIYPYAEVAGRPHPATQIETKVTFQDGD
jgi:transglutaminase-like putative cysteine protease